jgi:hypothetical protein
MKWTMRRSPRVLRPLDQVDYCLDQDAAKQRGHYGFEDATDLSLAILGHAAISSNGAEQGALKCLIDMSKVAQKGEAV